MRPSFAVLFLVFFSSTVFADINFVCTQDSVERKISVVYSGEGVTVPCEVQYTKDTATQILWSAQVEEGYCEAKASEFVAKQEGFGWSCAKQEMIDKTMEPSSSEAPSAE